LALLVLKGNEEYYVEMDIKSGPGTIAVTPSDAYSTLARRASQLAYFTVGYNALEALVAITSGLLAGSIALVGFGLDSVIETASGLTIIWRFRPKHEHKQESTEARAVRIIGATFFLLALYVTYEASSDLWYHRPPTFSIPGTLLAVLSLIVMPVLALAKRRLATKLASRALAADSTETLLCSYLSAALLLGLLANGWLGWWWADPVAALCMVPYMVSEGFEAFQGESPGRSGTGVRDRGNPE
jgi:divalent metal cation (Fe/Co/Zn/Cd) transporter